MMQHLPVELLVEVLLHLPPRELARQAIVCKHWEGVVLVDGLWKEVSERHLGGPRDRDSESWRVFVKSQLLAEMRVRNHKRFKWAIKKGHHNLLKSYMDDSSAMLLYLNSGDNLFTLACQAGHLSVVTLLAEEWGDSVITSNRQPLEAAITHGHPEVVQYLVQRGAVITGEEEAPANAVVLAVVHERLEVVRYLVKNGGSVDAVDHWGKWMTPLIAACSLNRHDVAEYLLDSLADPNLPDGLTGQERTPLMMAASNADGEMFFLLLRHGAKLDTELHRKEQLFIEACRSGSVSIVSHLMTEDKGMSGRLVLDSKGKLCGPLMEALLKRKYPVAELLLKNGASPNVLFPEDGTPLHVAVAADNLQLVSLLLDFGAAVNATDERGETPLFVAVSEKVVLRLIEVGAELNTFAPGGRGTTPLIAAILHENIEVMTVLLGQGALLCEENQAVIYSAISTGYVASLKLLFEHGVQVNLYPEGEESPLQFAAISPNPGIIEMLLQQGAELEGNAVFPSPLTTVLDEYEQTGHAAALLSAQHLLSYGAAVSKEQMRMMLQLTDESFASFLLDHIHTMFKDDPARERTLLSEKLWYIVDSAPPEMISFLVDRGANVNYTHEEELNGTPLRKAAYFCRSKTVCVLLEKGADPNLGIWGVTALELAWQRSSFYRPSGLAVMRSLFQHGAKAPLQVFISAITAKDTEVLEMLLDRVETLDADKLLVVGFTACHYGDEKVLQRLLERHLFGVKDRIKRKVFAGWVVNDTPLHVAIRRQNVEVIELLLREGADVHAVNDDIDTPLDFASQELRWLLHLE